MRCVLSSLLSLPPIITHPRYDMEDAMIINKSAMERGFKRGYIYKVSKGI